MPSEIDDTIELLRPLDVEVLRIIIKDGETLLAAQLAVAAASDQRAMTLLGFLITLITGDVGATLYIYLNRVVPRMLYIPSVTFVAGLLISVIALARVIRSDKFHLPGMRPSLWRPDNWTCESAGPHSVHQALLDQAGCLERAIINNRSARDASGKSYNLAIDITMATVLLTTAIVFILILS